ncbi:brachyurin-like [Thrips palmi]|uniref:Brachyurin-like n=1 Tax=Thrips palmi TaxID=161013 RepID=A0A6P8Y8H7_THRPL|nr:brachyurin-like [Thrips palmi]
MQALRLVTLLSAIILLQNAPDVAAISGGKMALPGQFPYQALIQPLDESGRVGAAFCSGVLIDPHWVLTAASCLNKNSDFNQVTLGAFDLSLATEETRLTYLTTTMAVHDGYNPDTKENDIALIKLDVAPEQNAFISPVRLPAKKQAKKSFVLWDGAVSGWGYTGKDDKTGGNWVLRWFDSRVEPNFWCSLRNGAQAVHDSHLCLSSIWKKGTCSGDSGSPVVITEWDGKPTLVGIATNEARSCGTHNPPVFTRVTSHLDWINKATGIALRE